MSESAEVRRRCRSAELRGPTAGLAPGFVQANLVVLPRQAAADFREFCRLNPRPCPLLEETAVGNPEPQQIAPGADLRTDLPRYRVWHHGELIDEPEDLRDSWRDDMVGFLLGCSFTFEHALLDAGLPMRHLEVGTNVPMYRTNRPCKEAGPFGGPLVVSMRPMTPGQATEAAEITRCYPRAHGAPVQIGDATALGIQDLEQPDFGDPVEVRPGEVPVFWACGVTPQAALAAAKPEIALTHSPGCMFVTDLRDSELHEPTESGG